MNLYYVYTSYISALKEGNMPLMPGSDILNGQFLENGEPSSNSDHWTWNNYSKIISNLYQCVFWPKNNTPNFYIPKHEITLNDATNRSTIIISLTLQN